MLRLWDTMWSLWFIFVAVSLAGMAGYYALGTLTFAYAKWREYRERIAHNRRFPNG